ncbi:MAG: hypothetical protein ACRCS9_11795 [Hyphomicrobium sp.]
MMDTTAKTFARRARLATTAIALAVALTLAALLASMMTSEPHVANFSVQSPISASPISADESAKPAVH